MIKNPVKTKGQLNVLSMLRGGQFHVMECMNEIIRDHDYRGRPGEAARLC